MSENKYVLSESEVKKLQEDASVSSAIKDLASVLSGRADDLPHRFRAPASMAQYMEDYATNPSVFHQFAVGYSANPLLLQITTRPTQKILELIFQGSDGMRLFTLEIEYGEK
jgi:hypothetical protein